MIEINAIGDVCPIPVIKAKNALKEMAVGQELIITVDNAIATQNLEKLAKESNCGFNVEKINDDEFRVKISKSSEAIEESYNNADYNTVVVISSDKMGEGNDELGHVLIKAFIYALTELDNAPNTVIFYNGGAQLSVEGSDSLEDLRKLEQKGTVIMTCGTCLNYYGISDKLAIGEISNMYSIVEKLAAASKIIRP